MNKIKEKLRQLMIGRYGMDRLSTVLMIISFTLVILGMFIQHPIPNLLMLATISWAMFRTYSRNISRRTRENEKFLRIGKDIKRNFSLSKLKLKEIRSHRFRTCPKCRVVIRTSTKRGMRTLSCPKCKTEFTSRIII